MEVKIYEKPVITKFVLVNGIEFELGNLYTCLSEIKETKEDDKYGDYSLRDYELSYPVEMDKLVKMELVKNYTGSQMANLYCMKDEKGIDELETMLHKLSI